MNARWRWAGVTTVVALSVGAWASVAGLIGNVWASGIPEQQTLTYVGRLEAENGDPLKGDYAIQLMLWLSADMPGTPACQDQPTRYKLASGRFSIPLSDACLTVVKEHADVWAELWVDGTSFGRAKLGAVPYAVESAHTISADRAAADFEVTRALRVGGAASVQGNAQVSGSLRVGETLIRKIARTHGVASSVDTDNGPISNRTLIFKKTRDDTGVRVAYTDNFRVYDQGACRWEIKFDDASCADPGGLSYDAYYGASQGINIHRPTSVFGTCFGLPAKEYTLQVYVMPLPAASGQPQGDCHTGWWQQYYALEAEEVY